MQAHRWVRSWTQPRTQRNPLCVPYTGMDSARSQRRASGFPMTPIGPLLTIGCGSKKSMYAEASHAIASGVRGPLSSRNRSLERSFAK